MGYASVSPGGVVWAGLTICVAPLDVTLMRDVPSRKEGFNSLVLPKGHRDLVEALVQTHSRGPRPTSGSIHDKEHEVDLVRGKGKTQAKSPCFSVHDTDLIKIKGKDLSFCSMGPRGWGKHRQQVLRIPQMISLCAESSTECVADFTGRPLFAITCGNTLSIHLVRPEA